MAFDHRTTKLNRKGQVVSESPYTLFIDGGKRIYERPPGSGLFFYEDGEEAEEADYPAGAVRAKKQVVHEPTKAEKKEALKVLAEVAEDHAESDDKNEVVELSDEAQDAIDMLLGEDGPEQISATKPTKETNAKKNK